MGGRLLEPFERLAQKIREQQRAIERASRDLVQIKQAFIILGLLSVAAPVALLVVHPDYLQLAFGDPLGRLLLQAAIIVELGALLLFRKITVFRV